MEPIIVENFCNAKLEVLNSIESLTGKQHAFHQGDIRDEEFLDTVFAQHDIQ
ncbi:UDP-glucose 4-epimerase, partial [Vibrio parahaemolyticus]|nr:UDP-glucose 4-epimerase [Vibrio parahaemolyticus]